MHFSVAKSAMDYDVRAAALWRSAQRGDLDELRKQAHELRKQAHELRKHTHELRKHTHELRKHTHRSFQYALDRALRVAVWNEHADSVALLLLSRADPNARVNDECTLFTLTGRHVYTQTICLLAQYGARASHGEFIEFANSETKASVCALVQNKVNVDGNVVARPLIWTCRRNPVNFAVIAALIRCKANVNSTEAPFETTALHAVCRQPQRRHVGRLVKMLLDAKADPERSAEGYGTPRLMLDRALSAPRAQQIWSPLQIARITAVRCVLIAAQSPARLLEAAAQSPAHVLEAAAQSPAHVLEAAAQSPAHVLEVAAQSPAHLLEAAAQAQSPAQLVT